jgi:hypothetical protein
MILLYSQQTKVSKVEQRCWLEETDIHIECGLLFLI